ncbi:MAG: hypothetical protein B7Z55_05065, partial [Planctomycetales bacterium 12-60-4]
MSHELTLPRLLVRSLTHYWRTNLAIVAGVVVGTAVIGGALIVGDSVRASLRKMTFDRLGGIQTVVTGHRFFREQLAADLQAQAKSPSQNLFAPAIVLIGGVERHGTETTRRSGQVNIYGVDERAWSFVAPSSSIPPVENGAFLNPSLAAALDAQEGDEITLWIELPSAVPRDTLLGNKDNDAAEITVKVAKIL